MFNEKLRKKKSYSQRKKERKNERKKKEKGTRLQRLQPTGNEKGTLSYRKTDKKKNCQMEIDNVREKESEEERFSYLTN